MTPHDALFSIAEIGIGLAGFSGLVAAFIQPTGHTWRPEQKARIVLLIILSFGLVICSLAPYALAGIGDSPALVWGPPMLVFSTLCIGLIVFWMKASRRFGFRLRFPLFSIPVIIVASALQVAAFLSGLGLIIPYSQTLFVFGLLSVLVFGANLFLALLYSVWE